MNGSLLLNEEVSAIHYFTEAVVQSCSVKKVFLKISQNSQEKTPVPPSYH